MMVVGPFFAANTATVFSFNKDVWAIHTESNDIAAFTGKPGRTVELWKPGKNTM